MDRLLSAGRKAVRDALKIKKSESVLLVTDRQLERRPLRAFFAGIAEFDDVAAWLRQVEIPRHPVTGIVPVADVSEPFEHEEPCASAVDFGFLGLERDVSLRVSGRVGLLRS